MSGISPSQSCQGREFKFSAGGHATGPYPGTFRANGFVLLPSGDCGDHGYHGFTGMSESFAITSGAHAIIGSSGGVVYINCLVGFCDASPKSCSYSAAVMRGGKVRKRFSGSCSENEIKKGSPFSQTLNTL
jgi:hypothetical protein